MKRKALGKGLSSLIPSSLPHSRVAAPASSSADPAAPAAPAARPSEYRIDVARIRPNRHQPRQSFDDGGLDELAKSIKTTGVLQPVLVRPLPEGRFELIAGERRWRAAQRAGIHQIPAVVREVSDENLLELALIENVQREGLNAIEEAQAYRVLVDDLGLTQNEVAERVGKQRASVANAIRLLTLPVKVQDMVRTGQLSMGHARALLSLENPKAILELAQRAVQQLLSVREVEARAKRPEPATGPRSGRPEAAADPNIAAAERTLQQAMGTKVRIVGTPKAGRVEIHYHSAEELDRVYELITKAAKGKA